MLFGFSPFLSALLVSVNFCLFLCVSVCFCPFLSVSVSFCQFRLVSVCFCPFLFVAVHFCPYLSVQVYFWHRRYYPHTSRDSVSPVCATCCGNLLSSCVQFSFLHEKKTMFLKYWVCLSSQPYYLTLQDEKVGQKFCSYCFEDSFYSNTKVKQSERKKSTSLKIL